MYNINDIKISNMQISDFNEIKDYLLQDFDDFWSVSVLEQELENKQNLNSNYFIAKNNENEIVGFAGILSIVDEINIMNIVVKKDKRMLGIGSYLLEFIIDFAKKHSYNSITLEVNENNLPAISLYKKYNFKQVGLRKKYYNNKDNAILMTLEI